MANPTPLWIPQNDVVLGVPAPTVDGFTDLRGTSVISPAEAEDMGYGTGPRIELSAGTFEDVIFSAIHGSGANDDFVYLSWILNSDQRFDLTDRIVVALRPKAALPHSQVDARRIDVLPVTPPDGADGAGGNILGGTYKIRTAFPAQEVNIYPGASGTTTWGPPGAPPGGLDVRVRSWVLPLPPKPFVHEHAWAVELKIPINKSMGGTSWIDLEPQFGLYWNLIRSYEPGGNEPPILVQYWWPRDDGVQRTLSGTFGQSTSIPGGYYGEAILPALGGAPAQPQGVKFRRYTSGIAMAGVKRAGVFTTDIDIKQNPGVPPNPPTPANNNLFAATLYNDHAETDAPGVLAEFRMANWGLNGAPPTGWAPIPADAGGTNPTASGQGVTVTHGNGTAGSGANVETAPFRWVIDSTEIPASTHKCVWIRLSADGTPVNFVESGLRINMDFVALSEHVRDAVIGGKGWAKLPRGRSHQFMMAVYARLARVSRLEFAQMKEGFGLSGDFKEFRFWNWFVKGFRNTYKTLEIDGAKYAVYEDGSSFGHLIGHRGLNDGLRFELSGLDELEPGRWTAKVPNGRELRFKYRLWTESDRPDEWGEPDKPRRPGDVIRDPRFRDPAALGGGPDEPFARPPWDPRPYPDSPER
jgi:hypothetical protein